MRKFKDWKISNKLGLVFILNLILLVSNFFSVNYYKSYDQLENDLLLQKTAENPLLLEKINSINTLFAYEGDTSKIDLFKSLVKRHQDNIDIFESGGEVLYLGNKIQCESIPIEDSAHFKLLKSYWQEYKIHLDNVINNRQFIISIGQYRRWNHLLNQILKTQYVSEDANIELYKLQVLMNDYLIKNINTKDEVLSKLAFLDRYIKELDGQEVIELKQVWSSLKFHIRFLSNRIKQTEALHFIENNTSYLINLEVLFKDHVNEIILKRKVSNHANLVIAMSIIILANLIIIAVGFSLVRQFVIVPVEQLDQVATKISNGEKDLKFTKVYDDEIGNTVDQLNEMIDSLKKLGKEKEIVERSLKYRKDFFANMSHELRTSLMGMLGMIDVLINHKDNKPEQQYYIDTLKDSSNGLMKTLNEILDVSKIEEGKLSIENEVVDLHLLLVEEVKLFSAKAQEVAVDLEFKVSDDVPKYLFLDPYRLKQVLSNLIGNALKYTYDGEVRINVSLDETRAHDLQLLFEVKDGGEGIKPEDFKSIFDQYKQTEKLAEKSKAGKGLGLTICKNLVELMGGEIGVMSEEGSGSVFWFSISSPIVEEADLKAYRKKIAPENRNFDRLSKHVLVVEDKKVNQVVLGLMIQKLGCTFDVVDNGEEAIETFEEGKYDYIFMDIRMPKMNGFECTQMLKEKYTNVPPIIGLSGETYDGVVEESIAKGLDAYLFKPVQIEILYDKMIELNDYQA